MYTLLFWGFAFQTFGIQLVTMSTLYLHTIHKSTMMSFAIQAIAFAYTMVFVGKNMEIPLFINCMSLIMYSHILNMTNYTHAYRIRLVSWVFTSPVILMGLGKFNIRKRIVVFQVAGLFVELFAHIFYQMDNVPVLYLFISNILIAHAVIRFVGEAQHPTSTKCILAVLWSHYGAVRVARAIGFITPDLEFIAYDFLDTVSKVYLNIYLLHANTFKYTLMHYNVANDIIDTYPEQWLKDLGIFNSLNDMNEQRGKEAQPSSTLPLPLPRESHDQNTHPESIVMFFDMVSFTRMSVEINSEALSFVMDGIYRKVDVLISKTCQHLIKVETIGDCYMCISLGSKESLTFRVEEAINFAQNVQSIYKNKFRFGMHIGTITRRPTGFCNVRDNYFGEAINIASRMESNSKPGHILVTNIVARHLQLDNECSQIDCKGIGLVMSSLIRL